MAISCLTWASDSHGLFDYESRNVFKKNFKVQCLKDAYRAIRIKTDVLLLPEEEAIQFLHQQRDFPASDVRSLLKLQWTNGAYHVIPSHASEVCIDPSQAVQRSSSHARSSNSSGAAAPLSQAAPYTLIPPHRPPGGPAFSPFVSSQDEGPADPAPPVCPAASLPDSDLSPRGERLPAGAGPGGLSRGPQSLFPPENAPHTSRIGSPGSGSASALNASRVVSPNPSSASSLAPGAGTAEAPVSSLAGSGSGQVPEPGDRSSSRAPSVNDPLQAASPAPGTVSNIGGSVSSGPPRRHSGPGLDAPADGGSLSPHHTLQSGTEPPFEGDAESQQLEPTPGAAAPAISVSGAGSPLRGAEHGASLRAQEPQASLLLPASSGVEAEPGLSGGGDCPRVSAEKIWLVVRSLRERGGVTLREGDVMKLGRFRLKVKELVANYQQAARAQEHRLPAADADECETVAPEPESHNPNLSVVNSQVDQPVPSAAPAPAQLGATDPSGASQTPNASLGNSAAPFAPLRLQAPFSGAAGDRGDRGDREEDGGGEAGDGEREEQLREEGLLDVGLPQSQTGQMPATAAATDDEDACGTQRPRRNEGLRQSPSFGALPDPLLVADCSLPAPAPATPRQSSEAPNNAYGCFLPQRPACRICLCEAPDEDDAESRNNPLVAPCRCKGSMQHVHLQCLRTWMEGRLNIRSDGTTVGYFLRALDCELCKAPYPAFVDGGRGRVIELFEIPRPSFPYIILEPRSSHPSPSSPSPPALRRGLHVVSLATRRTARLGRGHESDIRLSDISVSRLHALIKFSQGAFWLEDQRSKFGTLVELKRPLKLERGGTGVALQVGRTVISIVVKRQWSFPLPVCLKGVRAPESDITVLECPQQSPPSASLTQGPPAISPALASPHPPAGTQGSPASEGPPGARAALPLAVAQSPPARASAEPVAPGAALRVAAEAVRAVSSQETPQSPRQGLRTPQAVLSPRAAGVLVQGPEPVPGAPATQEAEPAPVAGLEVVGAQGDGVAAAVDAASGAAGSEQHRVGGEFSAPDDGSREKEGDKGQGEHNDGEGRNSQEAEGAEAGSEGDLGNRNRRQRGGERSEKGEESGQTAEKEESKDEAPEGMEKREDEA
nr:TPA: forkhead-aasociated domain-containing protein [Toxoplasma gondii VEG]